MSMRIKGTGTAVYHVMTRVVAGERLLDGPTKEVLRRMLWRVSGFCGVEVVAYCIMSNHFHVLVRVPEAREEDLDRPELLRRYALLYGEGRSTIWPDPAVMAAILEDEHGEEAALWEARLRARMNDLSAFMQTLKQRFTLWYNKSHKRFGTVWAERFKSVLVEDDPVSLQVVAAYIDLNPVRAGLVPDPGDYRWSSYGEAMGGEPIAQTGLASAMGRRRWIEVAADYRVVLFGRGINGRAGEQAAISQERVMEVLGSGGKVPLAELLRCRIRYFTEGAILGSEAFVRVEGARLPAARRKSAKTLGQLPIEDFSVLKFWRKLRLKPVS